ncbi:hypothetical protein P8452_21508 [Trifolium repens]|nr:hypothetical protein P8452_21508 [Trifolium repens]
MYSDNTSSSSAVHGPLFNPILLQQGFLMDSEYAKTERVRERERKEGLFNPESSPESQRLRDPGLVSGGPPLLRFSPPARLFRRVSLCFLVMASVRGLVPCRAAGGGSLRPDLELSLCVEGFVFFAGSIRGCFSSSGHVSFFV